MAGFVPQREFFPQSHGHWVSGPVRAQALPSSLCCLAPSLTGEHSTLELASVVNYSSLSDLCAERRLSLERALCETEPSSRPCIVASWALLSEVALAFCLFYLFCFVFNISSLFIIHFNVH